MPVWQALREELKDKNFEVITVACDSKGRSAAESWVSAAAPRHPSLLDVQHLVPELYNTRNVPAAFWIDERGYIVRANDPIYALRRNRETGESTVNERYLNALRDWVEKGPESIYVQQQEQADQQTGPRDHEDAQARAYFRLGVYLHQQGHGDDAIPHFKRAHELKPENWNYKRQAFNLGDPERDYGTTMQQEMQKGIPMYEPLVLPDPSPS